MVLSKSGVCPICGAYVSDLERHYNRHHLASYDVTSCDEGKNMTTLPEDMERYTNGVDCQDSSHYANCHRRSVTQAEANFIRLVSH